MQNKGDGDKDGSNKESSGFDKFLKRTKKQAPPKDDNRPATEPAGDDQEEDDKEEAKKGNKKKGSKDEEHEDLTEDEAEAEKEKEKEKKKESEKNSFTEFFMDPKNNPKWENIGLIAFLTSAFGYYLYSRGEPSVEITFNELIHTYIPQNRVKMITIAEDKGGEVFKYKAMIDMDDGKRVHIILPNV